MHGLIILACCVLACNAASLPLAQQPSDSSSPDWAVCNVGGKELKPGQRAPQGSFVFECKLDGQVIRTTIVACLDDGENGQPQREHPIDDTWETGTAPYRYVYQCVKTGTGAARAVAKCLYEADGNKVFLEPGKDQKVGNNTIRCDRMGQNGLQYHITYGQSAFFSSGSGTNTNTGSSSASGGATNTNTGSSSTSGSSRSSSNTNSGSSSSSTSTQQGTGSSSSSTNTAEQAVCYVNDRELKPGQRTTERGWVYECQVGSDGIASATIVACTDEGEDGQPKREHAVGETWEVGKKPFRFIYKCTKSGKLTASKTVTNCLYDGDEGRFEIGPGETKAVGKKQIKCQDLGGVNGLRYNIVQTDSGSASTSTNSGSSSNTNTNTGVTNADVSVNMNTGGSSSSTVQRSEPVPASSTNRLLEATCSANGRDVKIGERTTSGSFVYECQRVDEKMVRNAIVACLDDNKPQGEHPHGTTWVEGDKPFRYVFECTKRGDETLKKAVQCSYEPEDQPGKVTLSLTEKQTVGKFVVECGRLGEGGVQYHLSYSPEYIAAVNANFSGAAAAGSVITGVSNDAVPTSNTGNTNTGSGLHRCKRGSTCG